METPYRKFSKHKNGVHKKRDKAGQPVKFLLSFEEWMEIWLESGHWHERGCHRGQYVMSRYNDLGHYEVGNVFIQRTEDNIRQAQLGFKHDPEVIERRRLSWLATYRRKHGA